MGYAVVVRREEHDEWRSANLSNFRQHYDDVWIYEAKSASKMYTSLTDDDEALARAAVHAAGVAWFPAGDDGADGADRAAVLFVRRTTTRASRSASSSRG